MQSKPRIKKSEKLNFNTIPKANASKKNIKVRALLAEVIFQKFSLKLLLFIATSRLLKLVKPKSSKIINNMLYPVRLK